MDRTDNVITTYMERSLHLSLKKHFCPDESCHEVKIGRFVADGCADGTIYEIQTGNFAPLRKKIQFYLENTEHKIVIVRPLAKNRRIFWLDETSGELTKPARLSSKHEGIANGIADLKYLQEFLGHERVEFCFVLMEIDEIRKLDGYGKQKKDPCNERGSCGGRDILKGIRAKYRGRRTRDPSTAPRGRIWTRRALKSTQA